MKTDGGAGERLPALRAEGEIAMRGLGMKNRKVLYGVIAAVCVAALAIVFLLVWNTHRAKPQEGEKAYTLEVLDDAGALKSYEGRTDAEYLSGIMTELAEGGDFSYEAEEGAYGLFITTINGVTADFNTDGSYWAIYVNGNYGDYGADQQPVTDGDTFRFAYEK